MCHTFHDAIASSIKLQRMLFFAPRCLTRAERKTHIDILDTGPHHINQFVCPEWSQEFLFGHWKLSGWGMSDNYFQHMRMQNEARTNRMLPVLQIPLLAERMETAAYEGGSWRRMYLSTLPCEIIVTSTVPHRTFRFGGNMGGLIDTLDENYERVVEQARFPRRWAEAMASKKWKPTLARERDWYG